MRKTFPALLTLSFLALPGCMLAIGNGPDDEEGGGRLAHLEKRVSALEHQMQECSAACCEAGEHEGHDKAPPPPGHPEPK